MAQPTEYNRQFNFQNQQALTPGDPVPAEELDAEYNAVKLTLDQIIANLALIQRDDGALANQSVGRAALHSSIQLGFGAPTKWDNLTNYQAGYDTVFVNNKFYSCIESHLSDPSPSGFENDIAKWEEIADFSASAVSGLGTMSTQDADDVEITGGLITGASVTGLSTPSDSSDAASKAYVDARESAANGYTDSELLALESSLQEDIDDAIEGLLEAGTKALFQQSTAPTGWTKLTTHNDRALRVVSGTAGSGGAVAFSTVFARTATDAHTLTTSQIPSHGHSLSMNAVSDHRHFVFRNTSSTNPVGSTTVSGSFRSGAGDVDYNIVIGTGGDPNVGLSSPDGGHTPTGTVGNNGGGSSHSHNIDLRVHYVDVIIAERDSPT